MTATTTSRALEPAVVAFGRCVLAEWTKFRMVCSGYWTLLISAALTIGTGIAFLPWMIDDLRQNPAGRAAHVAVRHGWWFHRLEVGLLAVMVLGVLVATSEYSTGTIRPTLAAIPSRGRALAAKVVTFAAMTLVVGAVQAATGLPRRPPDPRDRSTP